MLPVPKFQKFLLMMTPFMVSKIALMTVFTLFIVLQESKETQHHWRRLPLEEMITYLILFPSPLSWTCYLIA